MAIWWTDLNSDFKAASIRKWICWLNLNKQLYVWRIFLLDLFKKNNKTCQYCHGVQRCYALANSCTLLELIHILHVFACAIRCGLEPSYDFFTSWIMFNDCFIIIPPGRSWLTCRPVQAERSLKHTPEKRRKGVNEIMRRLIQSLSGAECAELQQNYLFNLPLAGVRKGKKVARLLEINLPACPFTTVTSVKGDDFPFSGVVFYISALHVFVGASLEVFTVTAALLVHISLLAKQAPIISPSYH